jgi:hypothetical protein
LAPMVMAYSGPPMTLGGAAKAGVRIIVWCRVRQHQVEPDPAEMTARYGCGCREVDMAVTGTDRR